MAAGVSSKLSKSSLQSSRLIALFVFVVAVALALGVDARRAKGDEAASQQEASLPTPEQTQKLLEDPSTPRLDERPQTDPQAAQELPHRDLEPDEALELADEVFGAELENTAGIFDELEPTRFLSDYAAVIPSSALPEALAEGDGDSQGEGPAQGQVVVESTLPLRTESADGKEEAVDLTLQSPEGSGGELQPENPLTNLEIPAQLGEGIGLPDAGVEIEVVGAPEDQAPSNVERGIRLLPEHRRKHRLHRLADRHRGRDDDPDPQRRSTADHHLPPHAARGRQLWRPLPEEGRRWSKTAKPWSSSRRRARPTLEGNRCRSRCTSRAPSYR